MHIELPYILAGKTVTIVGGGPSLVGFDFSRLEGYVIAVNNSAFLCKSDMLVSLDKQWQLTFLDFLETYTGIFITDREAAVPAVRILYTQKAAYSHDWTMQKVNLSGFTALAVALYLKAARVFLLGFDGGYSGEKSNHYDNIKGKTTDASYSNVNTYFDLFADKPVINVGMGSKIDTFRKVPLESYFYAA